jgi:hypothetical protein
MIDKRIQLTLLEDNAGSFTDHSTNAADYLRDTITLNLAAGTDNLYVGFYKPINALYVELETVDALGSTLTLEAWDGASWSQIDVQDQTKGLSRSGFITWDRSDMSKTTVNGKEQYWVRANFDNGNVAVVSGANLVFSDDQMLLREFQNVLDPRILGNGNSSHIIQHVAARNLIVQMLRNEGYIKKEQNYFANEKQDTIENITQWDLLDIYEIREAATYLTLSKIFFLLSDEVDDNWWTKHREYYKMFQKTFNTAKLSVDTDNDGEADRDEKLQPRKSMRFSR